MGGHNKSSTRNQRGAAGEAALRPTHTPMPTPTLAPARGTAPAANRDVPVRGAVKGGRLLGAGWLNTPQDQANVAPGAVEIPAAIRA